MAIVSARAIEVRLSPTIGTAHCDSLHLADTPVHNVENFFSVDQSVQCRVVHIDEKETVSPPPTPPSHSNTIIYFDSCWIHLTNKPTLVNSPLRIITNYHHALPGTVAHGWISKIRQSEVIISFYNHVTGSVPSSVILNNSLTPLKKGKKEKRILFKFT